MPDFVYALFDFHPEHEDEVSFSAGERLEVLEKDDLYGDGWFQGRNLAGNIGLFPQSYTAPLPPSPDSLTLPSSSLTSNASAMDQVSQPKTLLHPLREESEAESSSSAVVSQTHLNGHDPNTEHLNGNVNGTGPTENGKSIQGDGEVMKATMTDVQKAIEQLGRAKNDPDGDGARSFSFASSRMGDRDTENETETDTDFEADKENGEDWHKGARRKLAEKARRAVEEAEKLEMMMSGMDPGRTVAPPIEVEVSDESDDEEEDHPHTHHIGRYDMDRQHPYIPEEDEGPEDDKSNQLNTSHTLTNITKGDEELLSSTQGDLTLPVRDESDLPTATAASTSFPATTSQSPSPSARDTVQDKTNVPLSPPAQTSTNGSGPNVLLTLPSADTKDIRSSTPINEPQLASKHDSITSSAQSLSPTPSGAPKSAENAEHSEPPKGETVQPSEWSVDEVVEWLKSKGFGQDVCDKFTEQEITGDVLLELDINLLKTEIGIMAFGKRMRIANAITDLRRPPSIQPASPQSLQNRLSNPYSLSPHTASPAHSRNPSQIPYSYSHGHSQSIQSSGQHSLHSPRTPGSAALFMLSPESAPHTGDLPGTPGVMSPAMNGEREERETGEIRTISDGSVISGSFADAVERAVVGLGIAFPSDPFRGDQNRPAQLMISPSDSALHRAASGTQEDGDEAGARSEGEVPNVPQSMRHRLFGRSQDSSSTGKEKDKRVSDPTSKTLSRKSKQRPASLSPGTSPTKEIRDNDNNLTVASRQLRGRKSSETGKTGERLSLFGNTFSAPLGKNRKPAPRYSSVSETGESHTERGSSLSITRLYGQGSKRAKNQEQSPAPHSPNKEKDPGVLRKRGSAPGPLKPGESILEQIGESDFRGWMRKKGDRYNSWKQRYFILKGSHLYCLRSDSKTETKIKGYINIVGYKVVADENANPGRYAFKIIHETDKTHFFSSDEKIVVREWMKAIMKATIGRDYTKPVMSSCNIPTIPLMVAQAMNPSPRPPSPTARDATQKALRRENPNQLSSRDARILMGLPSSSGELKESERLRLESFFKNEAVVEYNPVEAPPAYAAPSPIAPPRPPRERRNVEPRPLVASVAEISLIEWANSHLSSSLQITDPLGPLCGGLTLLRLAESIRGKSSTPPVPDSAFPSDPNDDRLDGLFKLFDFLLDNDVRMGTVSINDVRQGNRDKILQLLKALKNWEDKRKAFGQSTGTGVARGAGAWS